MPVENFPTGLSAASTRPKYLRSWRALSRRMRREPAWISRFSKAVSSSSTMISGNPLDPPLHLPRLLNHVETRHQGPAERRPRYAGQDLDGGGPPRPVGPQRRRPPRRRPRPAPRRRRNASQGSQPPLRQQRRPIGRYKLICRRTSG